MLSVLLIEDDLIVQKVHLFMLSKLGYEVDIAENGKKALEMIKKNKHYQIIFVDIGLPDITGFDVIKHIKTNNLSDAPIIALTGFAGEQEKEDCIQAGANEVLHKPIIIQTMRAILDKYRV